MINWPMIIDQVFSVGARKLRDGAKLVFGQGQLAGICIGKERRKRRRLAVRWGVCGWPPANTPFMNDFRAGGAAKAFALTVPGSSS